MRDMRQGCGVIFLDRAEVVFSFYRLDEREGWRLYSAESRDLTPFGEQNTVAAADYVEVIAEIGFLGSSIPIDEWKACARGIEEEVVREVSFATGLTFEQLTLVREQELICRGILMDPHF